MPIESKILTLGKDLTLVLTTSIEPSTSCSIQQCTFSLSQAKDLEIILLKICFFYFFLALLTRDIQSLQVVDAILLCPFCAAKISASFVLRCAIIGLGVGSILVSFTAFRIWEMLVFNGVYHVGSLKTC